MEATLLMRKKRPDSAHSSSRNREEKKRGIRMEEMQFGPPAFSNKKDQTQLVNSPLLIFFWDEVGTNSFELMYWLELLEWQQSLPQTYVQ